MDDIIIGIYRTSCGTTPIYLNPETEEVFYYDDQDMPYVIFGVELTSIPTSNVRADMEDELDNQAENTQGVIYDGDHKWVLTDDYKAYKVPVDSTGTSGFLQVVDYSDDTEYEPTEEE